MAKLALTLVVKDYDHLAPLAAGDVRAEEIDLTLDRDTANALDRTLADPSIQAGELSFARYLSRLSQDDRSWVGIPIFPTRAFRHRAFFVRRDSNIRDLEGLVGKRVGTNEWPATGNTWSRATLREAGIAIDSIKWTVGFIAGASAGRPQGDLPLYVKEAEGGRSLTEMLIAGELDALMSAAPRELYEPNSPIVRLFPDFRTAEQEYYRRTGIFPAHHIIGIRRDLFDREPRVARGLYTVLDQSKSRWQESRRKLAETTPWLQADIEDATAMIGHDWSPNGVEPNRKMIQTLCDELLAQDLLAKPLAAAAVFAEFEAATVSTTLAGSR